MIISLIAAMARNRVIGRNNALPWHLPADMKRFKSLTMGHAVVMGRKTFETLSQPLPGRRNIVLTRDAGWARPGVEVVRSLDEAVSLASGETELFVAGGAEVYRAAMPQAGRMYLTVVHAEPDGDTLFPEFSASDWLVTEELAHPADKKHAFSFDFLRYDRRHRAR